MNIKIFPSLLVVALLCSLLAPQFSLKAAEITWFVTNNTDIYDRPVPTTDAFFSCSDKIYAMLMVKDLPHGQHIVVFDWNDPSGHQRENEHYRFQHSGHRQHIWAWLTLHPPPRTIAFRLFNPSYGMQEFIGIWNLEISIDGTLLGKTEFEVLC